ncbi:hypothetical protein Emin_0891 [Elusimicrobium minutum Pei191]|uniref:Outer-membrane lipoprotein LolB n=1 Tax=Elusimicrobium minutum (strain Pei191) TaxID=445932 RepID=B2KD50_ELUMP|nr:hypothetical protein [Elusimicrobium minutum]ACC98446.1 hypothetical protein Emin_0891 [Elusimicrobium minutum Pei191]
MFKRITILLIAAVLTAGCAGFGGKKDYEAMNRGRGIPSYFSHGESAVAFKIQAGIRDLKLEGVLIFKEIDYNEYSIKMLGPLGTKVIDAVMQNGVITYNYILPDINTGIIKGRFEKFIYALLLEPEEVNKVKLRADNYLEVKRKHKIGKVTYVYPLGNEFPIHMSVGSIKMSYEDYREYNNSVLPYSLYYYDTFAEVDLKFELISII